MTSPDFTPDDHLGDRLVVDSFTSSPTIGQIAGALAKAQAVVGSLGKGSEAEVKDKGGKRLYSYTYATLADSLAAVRDAFCAQKIAIIQTPAQDRGAVYVTTMLAHESGEWMASTLSLSCGSGGRPQEVGSAITYARRYALQAMCGIAPEDDDGATAHQAATWGEKPGPGKKAPTLREKHTRLLHERLAEVHEQTGEKADWRTVAANSAGVDEWPDKPTDKLIRASLKGLGKLSWEELVTSPEDPDDQTEQSALYAARIKNEMCTVFAKRFKAIPKDPEHHAMLAAAAGLDLWPEEPTADDMLGAISGLKGMTDEELVG